MKAYGMKSYRWTGVMVLALALTATPALALINLDSFLGTGSGGKVYIPPVLPETVPYRPFMGILGKTTTTVWLEWQDKSAVEDGFQLYRQEDGGDWVLIVAHIEALEGNLRWDTYTDEGLTPGSCYCYRVVPYNELGFPSVPPVCTSTKRLPPQVQETVYVDNDRDLAEALKNASEGTVIYVADDAEIDLTGMEKENLPLKVKAGVTLKSGRGGLNEGALLFTSQVTRPLFQIVGDYVRITGLRIQGPKPGISEGDHKPIGIMIAITSGCGYGGEVIEHIEIDQNELYGWGHAAIYVQDHDGLINQRNAEAVRIHDNFIHHNQHEGSLGYGVVLGYGAYALIERNVFQYNRHAIAADGRLGTGYLAYRNLVLKDGGVHRCVAGVCVHTHQFDMHGRNSCGVFGPFSDTLYNCGPTGEYMDIRYNTFQYWKDHAFKLRGTPTDGADVAYNVFAHDDIGDALDQTETGLRAWGNLAGINTSHEFGEGDFDCDGATDWFQATGATWWYASGKQAAWRYLQTSRKRLKDLVLRDVDGNCKTDVLTQSGSVWYVSYDGIGPWTRLGSAAYVAKPSLTRNLSRFSVQ